MTDDTQDPSREPGDPTIGAGVSHVCPLAAWWDREAAAESDRRQNTPPFAFADLRRDVIARLDADPELYVRCWRWLVAIGEAGS